ncbi:MAG: hypothetical protein IKH15_06730 [Bacteroidales bacterium]|nr:hypothetical protein [Bacteroidales bacterium]MBR7051623.1 hypothetical protein [Bacteroidaceae bacterium]
MTSIIMESRCASCVAYEQGCCLLSELPVCAESVCTDYRPDEDERYKTRKSYGR